MTTLFARHKTHAEVSLEAMMDNRAYLEMVEETSILNNLSVMEKLRHLPRSLDASNRIAAIRSLLTEREVYCTLRLIRAHLSCPDCGGENIARVAPTENSIDDGRWYYECQTCETLFDDSTGTPFGEAGFKSLFQWILCWYLIAFCPLSKVGALLGLSLAEISKIADFTKELPNEPSDIKDRLDAKITKKAHSDKERKEAALRGEEKSQTDRRLFGITADQTRRFVARHRR